MHWYINKRTKTRVPELNPIQHRGQLNMACHLAYLGGHLGQTLRPNILKDVEPLFESNKIKQVLSQFSMQTHPLTTTNNKSNYYNTLVVQ